MRRDGTAAKLSTQSRITLYTGNTYFKLRFTGRMFRPFEDYASHLDVDRDYTLYMQVSAAAPRTLRSSSRSRRIGSRKRSSTTREYIGAVTKIEDLRDGRGEFDTEAAFYDYWRSSRSR